MEIQCSQQYLNRAERQARPFVSLGILDNPGAFARVVHYGKKPAGMRFMVPMAVLPPVVADARFIYFDIVAVVWLIIGLFWDGLGGRPKISCPVAVVTNHCRRNLPLSVLRSSGLPGNLLLRARVQTDLTNELRQGTIANGGSPQIQCISLTDVPS
jgi:hypothetical protein